MITYILTFLAGVAFGVILVGKLIDKNLDLTMISFIRSYSKKYGRNIDHISDNDIRKYVTEIRRML